LTTAPDRGEWLASCPGRFTLKELASHWVGPQNRSEFCGEEKSWPAGFRTLSFQPVAIPTELFGLQEGPKDFF
jgi:hypothetical protein